MEVDVYPFQNILKWQLMSIYLDKSSSIYDTGIFLPKKLKKITTPFELQFLTLVLPLCQDVHTRTWYEHFYFTKVQEVINQRHLNDDISVLR